MAQFMLLPSFMLSGFMFPFKGMPIWAQWAGELFPITHALRASPGNGKVGGGQETTTNQTGRWTHPI